MRKLELLKLTLASGACTLAFAAAAHANEFNIPNGDLKHALDAYMKQAAVTLMYPEDEMRGVQTRGAKGELSTAEALARILRGTGFSATEDASGVIGIVKNAPPKQHSELAPVTDVRLASVDHAAAAVETVVVTSSKIKGDIQTVPIAITALSQEQLTSRQIAGGPDLVKEVPNLTFSKTNFTGYNIEIRGIGTQAISVTTDPAVAVAFNDVPFIRNHFFEQEFYDVSQVEVLRGPQGTLYGRNATAGVVNVISAKPTDQFESMLSADIGNYHNRRYEGMINIPILDDRMDLRVAGEWTKRDGYSTNGITGNPIDGRDLWSTRLTLSYKPSENFRAYLVWEHFAESDDRMRTAKQLCNTAHPPTNIDGVDVPAPTGGIPGVIYFGADYLSQGCQAASLYSPNSFQVPFGYSLPYVIVAALGRDYISEDVDPYASTVQSHNLRVIESTIDPRYKAKNDTFELNVDYDLVPGLTFTSQTAANQDFLWSTEDYNRFNTTADLIIIPFNANQRGVIDPDGNYRCGADGSISIGGQQDCSASVNNNNPTGVFCDPQVGCASRLVAQDLSDENAWQLNQEFRMASNFKGPFNFSVGGNYMHYETEENYYVFINTLTLFAVTNGRAYLPYVPNVSDNHECLPGNFDVGAVGGYEYPNPLNGGGFPGDVCSYVDPNPIDHVNNKGHNYFLSQNPYVLNSYALFGESYYNITPDVKLTGGLRWTEDRKHFVDIPSEVLTEGWGYPSIGDVNQQWREWTGRAAVNWTPKFDFTNQTLIYGSYAHGYKAGGANPPGAALPIAFGQPELSGQVGLPVHPKTFDPEFIDAFEIGSKNTLADGALTLNGDVFFYDYQGYQISQIVDRTSINLNFDATVKGAEIESSWEPLPGLKFNFAGGYEDTRIKDGQAAIDLMDRAAGMPGWMVVKPFPTQASNCILPDYVAAALIEVQELSNAEFGSAQNPAFGCSHAYENHDDPVTQLPYAANPVTTYDPSLLHIPPGYTGFDPLSVDPTAPADVNNGLGLPPNNGDGFAKKLGGNQLPNAPHFTASLSGEYTIPVSEDWAATLHSDFYWQSQSFARVFNDRPYDKIRGYSTTNVALILTGASGWQVMGYVKNVFNVTAITGDFLNSDDSGLTTNVFLTDPRLFGVRVTKNW